MADRTFDQQKLGILKRRVELHAVFTMSGTTPVLQRWTYPSLGSGGNAYVAAATGTAPTGPGNFPLRFTAGADGVFSVARTGTGLWTVTLQDSYRRLLYVGGIQSLAGGAGTIVSVTENTTITNMNANAPGSVIGVGLLSATATLADPATLTTIKLTFMLQDASEP